MFFFTLLQLRLQDSVNFINEDDDGKIFIIKPFFCD